jgi:signal transduction histidine kinase
MKKNYYISLLAIAVIVCMQGLYISLQYNEFIKEKLSKTNNILCTSIDEELGLRSRKSYKPDKLGEQHLYYHILSDKETKEINKKKEDQIKLTPLDLNKLRKEGIANTTAEVLSLITQDIEMKKGNPINLKVLDKIFTKNLDEKYEHSILLLNSNKKIITIYGKQNVPNYWKKLKYNAIGLQSPKFITAAIDITPSEFIKESLWNLILSLLFVLIVIECVGLQLREIKRRQRLLINKEISINGTIHDLKSPLNSVITLMSFLKTRINDPDIYDMIEKTNDRTKKLASNIETILITASNKTKIIILKKENVDLAELAEKAKQDIDILFYDKPHEIKIYNNIYKGISPIADKMYLENVIRNLIENALKYSDSGVKVKIRIYNNNKYAFVNVIDNGWGISKKNQTKIFEQFYRITYDNSPKGYGIGLSLVKYMVELHGGTICVASKEGMGSQFKFSIPLF